MGSGISRRGLAALTAVALAWGGPGLGEAYAAGARSMVPGARIGQVRLGVAPAVVRGVNGRAHGPAGFTGALIPGAVVIPGASNGQGLETFPVLGPSQAVGSGGLMSPQAPRQGAATLSGELAAAAALVGETLQAGGEISAASPEAASGLGSRLETVLSGGRRINGAGDVQAAAARDFGSLRFGGSGWGSSRGLSFSPSGRSGGSSHWNGGRWDRDEQDGDGGSERGGFVSRVYGWMGLGLAVTAAMAWGMTATGAAAVVVASQPLFYGLLIAEVVLALALFAALPRISSATAGAGFLAYAALNGVTMAPLLLHFTAASVAGAFAITAGMFGGMAALGHFTKKDLSGVGGLAGMALLGLIIASIVNLFLRSAGWDLALTYLSVLIFVALTAYDAQRIRRMADARVSGEEGAKAGVIAALGMYLNFVILFMDILRLMGKERK